MLPDPLNLNPLTRAEGGPGLSLRVPPENSLPPEERDPMADVNSPHEISPTGEPVTVTTGPIRGSRKVHVG